MKRGTFADLTVCDVALTPKEDTAGVIVKLKVFWKTTRFWTPVDVRDFQKQAPAIAERLRLVRYWDKQGDLHDNKFTCEDFAIWVLSEYAAPRGLPVKLTTGVRTYRNMEMYNAEAHDSFSSDLYGFAEMVMLTYGAPDMQRTGSNTIAVTAPESLRAGDILAKAYDRKNAVAHHIQVVTSTRQGVIEILQGNSSGIIVQPFTSIMNILGMNRADPQNSQYAGMRIERGIYKQSTDGWDYTNLTTGTREKNLLKLFQLFRWNFLEFNR